MRFLCLVMVIALASCGPQQQAEAPANNTAAPVLPAPSAPPAVTNSAPAEPKPTTSLPEPKGLIDPKSAEAAGQVVQHYGALIEQGRWADARELWSDPPAAAKFEARLKGPWTIHMEIGELGGMEGAAGSSYVTVPATFYHGDDSRGPERVEAKMILRRVNDVPGSTEAQRRWHIERVE